MSTKDAMKKVDEAEASGADLKVSKFSGGGGADGRPQSGGGGSPEIVDVGDRGLAGDMGDELLTFSDLDTIKALADLDERNEAYKKRQNQISDRLGEIKKSLVSLLREQHILTKENFGIAMSRQNISVYREMLEMGQEGDGK